MFEVFKYENVLPVDVDETLITKVPTGTTRPSNCIFLEYGKGVEVFLPCTDNIRLLIHHKITRNYGIIVWSANGKEWAEKVVRTLDLHQYVDIIMTKPNKYVDDKPVSNWMPNQIYLGVK